MVSAKLLAPLTPYRIPLMYKIQEVFKASYNNYAHLFNPSCAQQRAALSILYCKSGHLGYNFSTCTECGHSESHSNSCRNRNCPCCQGILKELWIDARKAEVIDAPYFHVVFTIPAELNSLLYRNQSLLYSLLHRCSSETLLELSQDRKYLGATPGIIQVLHTWGQSMNYHPHIHCIVTGAGLTPNQKFVKSSKKFFIPVQVLGSKFRGKFLYFLEQLYKEKKLDLSADKGKLLNSYSWKEFKDKLHRKTWIPFIKETFNGFGNAIDYLGRYTHRIAISNSRIKNITDTHVTFAAKDYKTGANTEVTLTHLSFIRRFLLHVLPSGFQKIRYYGILNNRMKKKNLALIRRITGKAGLKSRYSSMSTTDILKELWNIDTSYCPACQNHSMRHSGRTYSLRN